MHDDRPHSRGKHGMARAEKTKERLERKVYEKEMHKLQVELCRLQDWVKAEGLKVIVVFEGRDAAGKGGTIKALTERVSPRVFRVVALPAPSDREKGQMFIQRYIAQFPAAGEIVIFDRSWYNRAGVEYVMGFATKEQHKRFLQLCPDIEDYIIQAGIILIKIWLEVGMAEQERRFKARIEDPMRQWKLSPMDVGSYGRWYDYSKARDLMLECDRLQACAMVHCADRRQTARPIELHLAYSFADSLQENKTQKGQIAPALEEKQIRRSGFAEESQVRGRTILRMSHVALIAHWGGTLYPPPREH